jgi:hypothetical protein
MMAPVEVNMSIVRRMIRPTACLTALFILTAGPELAANPVGTAFGVLSQEEQPRAENLRFDVAEAGVVRIFYDLLADNPQQLLGVRLVVSQDGGQTFDVTATTVSGDVGPAVVPGSGKRITWEAARDVERLDASRLRLRLVVTIAVSLQKPRRFWGVSAAVVPHWREWSGVATTLFDAQRASFGGSELRVGIMRGRSQGRDWGVSLVSKGMKTGSTLVRELYGGSVENDTYSVTPGGVWLTGAELDMFVPFTKIGERVEVGALLAGGLGGTFRGTVERRTAGPIYNANPYTNPSAKVVEVGPGFIMDGRGNVREVLPGERVAMQRVAAGDLRVSGWDVGAQLLGRAELAASFLVRPQLKVRVTGGFNFPGFHLLGVELVHLFGMPTGR